MKKKLLIGLLASSIGANAHVIDDQFVKTIVTPEKIIVTIKNKTTEIQICTLDVTANLFRGQQVNDYRSSIVVHPGFTENVVFYSFPSNPFISGKGKAYCRFF